MPQTYRSLDTIELVPLLGDAADSTAFVAAAFTADLTATLRDDGALWLMLPHDLRVIAKYSLEFPHPLDPTFRDDDHVAGSFPASLWHGIVAFQRTPDALWLVTLPDGNSFTVLVLPDDGYDRGPEKVCAACHLSKPVGLFAVHHRTYDGLQRRCMSCSGTIQPRIGQAALHSTSNRRRSRRTTAAGRRLANAVTGARPGSKTCPECLMAKAATTHNFGPDPQTTDGLQHRCRKCSGTVPGLLWALKVGGA